MLQLISLQQLRLDLTQHQIYSLSLIYTPV